MNTSRITSSTSASDGSDLPGALSSPDCNIEFEMIDSTVTNARDTTTVERQLRDLEQALNNLKVTLLKDSPESKSVPSTAAGAGFAPRKFLPSRTTLPDLPILPPTYVENPVKDQALGLGNSSRGEGAVDTLSLMEFQLQRTKDKLQESQQELRIALSRIHTLTKTCAELKVENQEQAGMISTISREFQEYKQNSSSSDLGGRETIGNVIFSAKADELCSTDVKEKVVALNDLIVQTAGHIGSTFVHRKWDDYPSGLNSNAFVDVCRTVSRPLARALIKESKTDRKSVNPLLAQVVLEVLFVQFCASKIGLWIPGEHEFSNVFKTQVHDPIRKAEKQAVSGAWRAFTLSHLRPASTAWKDEFMTSLTNLLRLANWQMHLLTNLVGIEAKLSVLFEAVQDLRAAIGEKVTSVDLELNVVPEGAGFDHRWMVDAHSTNNEPDQKSSPRSGEIVAGTTGLGLKTPMTPVGEKRRFKNLLAPKVALMSTLEKAGHHSKSNLAIEGQLDGRE